MTYGDDRTAGALGDEERRDYVRRSGGAMSDPTMPAGPERTRSIWYNLGNSNGCGSGALTPSRVVARRRRSHDVTTVSPSQLKRNRSGLKQCRECRRMLPYADFDHMVKDGVNKGPYPQCRECLAKWGISAESTWHERVQGRRIKRFWSHVEKQDGGCWLWTGPFRHNGYGEVCIPGGKTAAHRFSYELEFGPIPDGLHVCHRCDTPACVNPDHLFLGTARTNAEDRERKHRNHYGPDRTDARLTVEQVQMARERYVPRHPEWGVRAMARRFGVHSETLSRAIRGKSWKVCGE